MGKLEKFFEYEELDYIAKTEKIYYSPSVGWDKINSKKIYNNRAYALKKIQEKVLSGNYKFVPYKVHLIIKDENSKPRKTCIPAIKDRIVISAVKRYLYDAYKKTSFNVSANSIIREITNIYADKKRPFYIKIDLESFFDNINHDILLEKIKTKVNDPIIIDLITKILKNPQKYECTDTKKKNLVGVPQGISIATLLANIYLYEFDKKYKERKDISFYRYVDDIIIFADSKEKIDEIFTQITYELERKYLLKINSNKTKRGSIYRELEYLGYRFENDLISIRESSILKFERNLEKVFKNFSLIAEKDERQIKKFIWLLNIKITGILVDGEKYGWLLYFDCINDLKILKKMDLLVIKFLKRFKIDSMINTEEIKKFTRAYYEIHYKRYESKYLLNINVVSTQYKKDFLENICALKDIDKFSEDEIDYRFRYNLYRSLKSLERDIDSISK